MNYYKNVLNEEVIDKKYETERVESPQYETHLDDILTDEEKAFIVAFSGLLA